MFGLGVGEALILGLVLLLFFGPKRLPAFGSSLGHFITNFKKGLNGQTDPQEKIEDQQQQPPATGSK